jgi:hypothetical protein
VVSSEVVALSLVSSSERVRWVAASSERICAREEGEDTSAEVLEVFGFGVPGRMVLVEAVGVDASSSAAGAARLARVAVRSASFVSTYDQYRYHTSSAVARF